MNTNINRKLITEFIIDSDLASSISMHSYYSGHSPFWYTNHSYFPPDNLSRKTIKRFLKVYKSYIRFLFLARYFDKVHCMIKMASFVPYPDAEPDCISTVLIEFLVYFSVTQSVTFIIILWFLLTSKFSNTLRHLQTTNIVNKNMIEVLHDFLMISSYWKCQSTTLSHPTLGLIILSTGNCPF